MYYIFGIILLIAIAFFCVVILIGLAKPSLVSFTDRGSMLKSFIPRLIISVALLIVVALLSPAGRGNSEVIEGTNQVKEERIVSISKDLFSISDLDLLTARIKEDGIVGRLALENGHLKIDESTEYRLSLDFVIDEKPLSIMKIESFTIVIAKTLVSLVNDNSHNTGRPVPPSITVRAYRPAGQGLTGKTLIESFGYARYDDRSDNIEFVPSSSYLK